MRGPLRQHGQPGAHVFAALVIVRGGGQHRVRPQARARRHRLVEGGGIERECTGVGADFVARQQPSVAVARGVFHRLGRHRRRQLLAAPQRKLAQPVVPGRLAAEPGVEPRQQRLVDAPQVRHRVVDGAPHDGGVLRIAAVRVGIGAVDAQVHDQFGERAADGVPGHVVRVALLLRHRMQGPGRGVQFGGEVFVQDAAPCRQGRGTEVRFGGRPAGPVEPGLRQRGLAGGIVQQRTGLVHEVVAAGAVDIPAGAHGFVGGEDFSTTIQGRPSRRSAGRWASSAASRWRSARQ